MSSLLLNNLGELIRCADQHSSNTVFILGDLLGDFYELLEKKRSRTNAFHNLEKIALFIDYIEAKQNTSPFLSHKDALLSCRDTTSNKNKKRRLE